MLEAHFVNPKNSLMMNRSLSFASTSLFYLKILTKKTLVLNNLLGFKEAEHIRQ